MEPRNQDSFEMAVHGPCCGPVQSLAPAEREAQESVDEEKPQYWLPCD